MNVKSIVALAVALVCTTAHAADSYSGDAYLLDGGALVYSETHYLFDGEHLVVYTCPDGGAFARKSIHINPDPQAPDFSLINARIGYREGVRGTGAAREIFVQRAPDQPEKTAALDLPPDGVIDAGFDVYVRRHWDALVRGDTLRFAFLVPSKRTFYAFDLAKVDGPRTAPSVTLRLSLGAWYAFLAPHIDVTYERATRRLLRFTGMSNMRDAKLKNLNVRIEFPHAPTPATAEEIAAARDATLATSCAESGQ
ncbi:MAG: hypothetical protein ACREPN_07190 [Rudaea sp.]